MHGNLKYMHCASTGKCKEGVTFSLAPSREEVQANGLPRCRACKELMRPHAMFFDDFYTQTIHRADEVKDFIADGCDGMIVVGTALETGLALGLVQSVLMKGTIPVVEVNLEPVIKSGKAYRVAEKSEIALPRIFDWIINANK